MCNNMLELQEQLETTKTSLADSERKKRAAERQKKTLEDMNKRLAAETESSMDISGDEHESLLEELQKKNEELEKQQAGLSQNYDLSSAGDQPSAATLSAAAGLSAGGDTPRDAGGASPSRQGGEGMIGGFGDLTLLRRHVSGNVYSRPSRIPRDPEKQAAW